VTRVARAAAAVLGPLVLAGCLQFPWYEPPHFGGDDGPDRELVVGSTTIDEVLFALGAPTRYRGDLLVYSADRIRGIGGTHPGVGHEVKQVQMLWLEFDAHGLLASREIRSGEICTEGENQDLCRHSPVLAPDRLNLESRAFAARPGSCSLYLYSDAWFSPPAWRVGGILLGPAGRDQFFHLEGKPGRYLVETGQMMVEVETVQTSWPEVEVTCRDGGVEFVRSRWGSGRPERVDAAEAREALDTRQLALDAAGGRLR